MKVFNRFFLFQRKLSYNGVDEKKSLKKRKHPFKIKSVTRGTVECRHNNYTVIYYKKYLISYFIFTSIISPVQSSFRIGTEAALDKIISP